MGMLMSYMGGLGTGMTTEGFAPKTLNLIMGTLYDQFIERDVQDFESFHLAILDLFNSVNMALPGKHYDPPPLRYVEELFEMLSESNDDSRRKKIFLEFMQNTVNLNKADHSMVITGIVAPPAAMVAKRTGQVVPQLSVLKAIPDVIFVPTATIVALIAVKFSKIKLMRDVAQSF